MEANKYYEIYNRPRDADDRDLVAEVRQVLVESGLAQEAENFFDTNQYIVEAKNKSSEFQRQLLNRFWTIQLLSVDGNSEDQRYSLIPNGSLDDWKRLFQMSIVPFAVQHRLPRAI